MHDELILNNIPLIYKCIKDMRLYWNTEDEFQSYYDAGLLGLINGAKTYNESKAKQSTYLYTCIKNEIRHEIAMSLMQKRKVHKEHITSLDKLIKEDSDTTLADMIPDPNINIEEDAIIKAEFENVISSFHILTPKQRKVIEYRFGLNDSNTCFSFEEIALKMNVSRNAIFSMNRSAMKKLQDYHNGTYKRKRKIIKNKKMTFEEELKKSLGYKEGK